MRTCAAALEALVSYTVSRPVIVVPRAFSGAVLVLPLLLAGCGWLAGNQRPVAAFSYSLSAEQAPTVLALDASGSFDPDGEIVTYRWTVGGAQFAGRTVAVPLTAAGEQHVRLVVTDDKGAMASAEASFELALAPAALGGPEPDSLALAGLPGQTVAGQVELANLGGENLTIAVTSDAPWLSADPSAVELELGGSLSLAVVASCPDVPAALAGELHFASNDALRTDVSVRVTVDCSQPVDPGSGFDVTLLFSGDGFTPAREQVFLAAAARWSEVIVGDLPDVAVNQAVVDACAREGSFITPGVVDDLLVLARITDIDGPGSILGQAGICNRRSGTTGLPVLGHITLDTADVAQLEGQGRLYGVVLHEIGHLLDLNSVGWVRQGLLAHDGATCASSTSIAFIGPNAAGEWVAAGGTPPLPVEADGGAGTRCSHWDEEELGSELMTGWASGGMELSKVTVGALHDLGYQVDYSKADAFTAPLLAQLDTDAFELIEIFLPEFGPLEPLDDSGSGDRR